jgi:hypothetical protein
MLHDMEQTTASASTSAAPNFASLLAALATPGKPSGSDGDEALSQKKEPAPAWNDDALEDDVITLSYERALRANARYRPEEATGRSLTQAANPQPAHLVETPAAPAAAPRPAAHPAAPPSPEAARPCATPLERNLKDASITIRMSQAECAQLHRRAAEAGMTVSAYLRSCTFETESLRAMVKETLAQLRSATAQAQPTAPRRRVRAHRLGGWLARLMAPWRGSQRVAQA